MKRSSSDLRAALVAAFPPQPITREMIDEPTSRWWNYEEADAMKPRLEGRQWTELDEAFLEPFHDLIICAGTATYCAVLPAYLAFLLELDGFSWVPFAVAGQLTRQDDDVVDQKIFDARIAPMTAEQRTLVAEVVELLATRAPMENAMKPALKTWQNLTSAASNSIG